MALLTDEHRAAIGNRSKPVSVEVSRRDIIKYSVATEQQQAKYTSGDEAPPLFAFGLFNSIPTMDRYRPDGIPRRDDDGTGLKLPLKRMMAGGIELRQHRPIHPGDKLTGVSTLTDVYEKEGRSGPLIFTVREFNIINESGEPVIDEISTLIAR